MKLLYAPQSPFARKVRAAAIELGLGPAMELVYTEAVPGRKNADFARSHNPLRKVPTLVVDDRLTIQDSTVICEYLDESAGGGRLLPGSGDERWHVLSQHALAQGVCEAAVLIRYETWIRPPEKRWNGWVDDQWDKVFSVLDWFEANPATLRTPGLNIAHLALMSGIGYIDFRFPEKADWRGSRPSLSSWVDQVSEKECFRETVPSDPLR